MSDPQLAPAPAPHDSARRRLGNTLRAWRGRAKQPKHPPAAPAPRRNLSLVLRTWHQRAGLFAFAFMAWLGASGVVLNQSVSWGLDATRVQWGWLMALYGLHAEPPPTGFAAAGHWLASTAESTVLDGRALDRTLARPLGFVAGGGSEPLLFVASSDTLVVLRPDGTRVDELRGYTLPVAAIRRIGRNADGAVVVQDLDAYASVDGMSWQLLGAGADVRWSSPERLPDAERARVTPFARPSIAVEQILIDAHSGRLFGRFGPWVINAVGLAAVLLSVSGIWMYWRNNRRRQQARR